MVIPVSAKTQEGVEDLLEAVLLVAEETDIRANPKGKVFGTVIEGELDRSRGVLTTLLVQNGTLQVGQVVETGMTYGKIRAMFDYRGNPLEEAGPSVPVQIMGMDEVPVAGDIFEVVENERAARAIIDERERDLERAELHGGYSLDEIFARFQAGETQSLNLIIKADVQGSLEPIVNSLNDLAYEGLEVKILRADTGNITESDMMLAQTSDAIVLGFCVESDAAARMLAEVHNINIRTYNIIYKLIEDVDKALRGMLAPEYADVVIGRAEVRAIFRVRRFGTIAGCYVQEGEIRRNAKVRVWRDQEAIHDGDVGSLKRFEEDVREVRSGFECGVGIDGYDDLQEGDILEFYVVEQVN